MVKIRLSRLGTKGRPFYRIVAIDERDKREGRPLEYLGTYDPKANPARIDVKLDRVQAWVKQGAQLSETVHSIVERATQGAA